MLRRQLPLRLLQLESRLERDGAMARAVATQPLLYLSMTFTNFTSFLSALFSLMSLLQCFACTPSCFEPKLVCTCSLKAKLPTPRAWLQVHRRLPHLLLHKRPLMLSQITVRAVALNHLLHFSETAGSFNECMATCLPANCRM